MNLRAAYNPETDEISGCEENSLEWWHERGHQVFHRSQLGFFTHAFDMFQQPITFMLLFWMGASFLPTPGFFTQRSDIVGGFLILLSVVWCCLFVADELFAWLFAFANYKRKQVVTK